MIRCHRCGIDVPDNEAKAWRGAYSTGYTDGPRGQRWDHYEYRMVYLCQACYAKRIRRGWIAAGIAIVVGIAALYAIFLAWRHLQPPP